MDRAADGPTSAGLPARLRQAPTGQAAAVRGPSAEPGRPRWIGGHAMTPCPGQEQLERLLAEQLAEAERGAVEGHVEGCAACQVALGRLAGGPTVWPGER